MEELQDAIEDAQYVNAISTQEDGPRPVLAWEIPSDEELAKWKRVKVSKETDAFQLEWTCKSPLGFFMFSAYLKDDCDDYLRINFVEEVLRWKRKRVQGPRQVQRKLDLAGRIVSNYLEYHTIVVEAEPEEEGQGNDVVAANDTTSEPTEMTDPTTGTEPVPPKPITRHKLPRKTEIDEYDLERPPPNLGISEEEFQQLCNNNIDPSKEICPIGLLDGPIRDELLHTLLDLQTQKSSASLEPAVKREEPPQIRKSTVLLPNDLFDIAEAVVMESLRREYWASFVESNTYQKLLSFLWFQDRPVVPQDFFTMRVLGRGGFGLVTACKKGTSGKLYAMKIMSKKRIKMKKAQGLALNERAALAAIQSPFVVNLKYSFHSKDDIYLILDLMAGGDLGFHLQQKGRFPKRECIYYAARIMLGLQALHDKGYVYRDLKPENCLVGEDGRVKLTDFGLATKVKPGLHGAAGTRGYWAPEMLRRDDKGKRMPYGHAVDWFSFGCCVAEFISGSNPFRSEVALNFGLERGKETKEKAIDCATLEMDPILDPVKFSPDASDFCLRLLDKNENTRLGTNGCEEIMSHPWFKDADWDLIISDRKKPPYVPPKDVNAASQSEIGTFAENKAYHETVVTDKDEEVFKNWDWTNPKAFSAEVIEFLIYERETGEPLLPMDHNSTCCCTVS